MSRNTKVFLLIVFVCIIAASSFGCKPAPVYVPRLKEFRIEEIEKPLKVGENVKLNYYVKPSELISTMTWESENPEVIEVDENGYVTALSEGKTNVTGLVGEATKTITITVSNNPDLKAIYEKLKTLLKLDSVVQLGSDGSYLSIDSNPYDKKNYTADGAIEAIIYANEKLGFSQSLLKKMIETSALDGIQHDENEYIKVSWGYNPNQGLSIIYELKRK